MIIFSARVPMSRTTRITLDGIFRGRITIMLKIKKF